MTLCGLFHVHLVFTDIIPGQETVETSLIKTYLFTSTYNLCQVSNVSSEFKRRSLTHT